jgi:PIN like domain
LRVFVDEDTGSGIAQALLNHGLTDVDYVGSGREIITETPDIDWLPFAGQNSYLLLSRNKAIFRVPAERQLFISEQVGAVFLPGNQATGPELVSLVMERLSWLEHIYDTEPRPFAFILHRTGRVQRKVILP